MNWSINDRAELVSPRPGYTGSHAGTVVKVGARLLHVRMDHKGNGPAVCQLEPWRFRKI